MLPHDLRATTAQNPAEHERDKDRVVKLTRYRDEVRHEVDWHREVSDQGKDEELPARGNTRVRE